MEEFRLLITGADYESAGLISEKLAAEAPHVLVTASGSVEEALELVKSHGTDCILACCRMRPEDCEPVLKGLMEAGIGVPVIAVTSGWEPPESLHALKGVYEIMSREEALDNFALLIKTMEHAVRHGRAERALELERKNLRVILDSIGESIILQDKDFRIVFQNKANIEMIGRHKGEDCYTAFEKRSEICEVCPILDSFKDGKVHRVEKRVPLKEGELHVELTGSTLTDLDGNIVGGVKVVRDVTERKIAERQRADFVAMISHDLKAPLSVIGGYADLMLTVKRAALDNETLNMAEAVKRSSKKLQGMVEDFLTMSRMESGELPFKPEPVRMEGLIAEIIEDNSAQAAVKGIELSVMPVQDMPELMLDKKLIERAVSNLVRNAVGFTPRGGKVSIGAELSRPDGDGRLTISVSDTGPGIPEADRCMVFDKYYRAASSGHPGGSGLGLAVVKSVAQAHGGRVELESQEGKGSTFRIILPVRK